MLIASITPITLRFLSLLNNNPNLNLRTPLSFLSHSHTHFHSLSSSMDPTDPPLLILHGKSHAEIELATSLKSNNSLKLPDHPHLSLSLHTQLNTPPPKDPTTSFDVDSFMTSLSTSRFGRLLIFSPRLPSTHDVVSHNFTELPVGTVCIADVQFKGRGRSANVWESPPGCLMFSYTMQMEDGRVVPLVQYVASLAITEAIKELCLQKGLPQLDVRIKWPNDLYLKGLKVGGVLCTSTYRDKKFNISVGIGLNVDNREPTICLNGSLQEMTTSTCQLRKEDILASFFGKFEKFFELLTSQGFKSLENLYYQTWLHSGQRVTIQDKCEDKLVDSVVTIQGLTASGYLMALGDDGQMYELHPDGNSFDFFKGLVRHKLC